MIHYIVFGFLLATASCITQGTAQDGVNIYASVLASLEELKLRQMAEEMGINYAPTNPLQHGTSVCYDELGCFDKEGTFKHLKQLPEPPEKVNTQFLLYTRKNPHEPQLIDYRRPETILNSNLDGSKPIKFITHGFGGRNNLTWVWNMKNAFLKMEDLNVVAVDWSVGAKAPYYIAASVNSELVGAQIAVLYYFIKDNFGIEENNLHVVGFSLGAHVSGFVGKRMMEMRGTRPARITGLDPASPFFEDHGDEVHLSKNDADYVEVIHTNADSIFLGGLGMEIAVGHADYYPNGGKRQPGCESTLKGAFTDLFNNDRRRACNHERAVHLFIESILNPTSCQFISFPCSNYEDLMNGKCHQCSEDNPCGVMGYNSIGRGMFYLLTKENTPYCAEAAKLTVNIPKNIKKSYGALTFTLVGHGGEKENVTVSKKDGSLKPGDQKVQIVSLGLSMSPVKEIEILYELYNGFFVKGKETFTLQNISLVNAHGKVFFKNCKEVVLKDNVPTVLPHMQDDVC